MRISDWISDVCSSDLTPSRPQNSPEILAPLTPRLAVLYARPMQYTTEPRLSTLVIGADETETLNHVVQIYARDKLFYRSDKPVLTDEYRVRKHLQFSDPNHLVIEMIHDMPGVPDGSTHLNFQIGRESCRERVVH